jgi:predicted dehydrogenase
MDKIKIVHVGLGGWGGNWALHVLPTHPDVEVVGWVEILAERRKLYAERLGALQDRFHERLEQAFAAGPVDAVTIAVPIALHEPLARQALEAGKHVVVEKPFTATLPEAKGLVDLARRKKLTIAVSQNYRYYPASQLVAGVVRNQALGRLVGGKIDFRRNSLKATGGNLDWPDPMLADMAVHHYDLMRMITGVEPVEINARSWNPSNSPYKDDPAAAIVLTFPENVTISYRGSWVDAAPQTAWAGEWQLDFEKASIWWTSRGSDPWQMARDRVRVIREHEDPEDLPLAPCPLHDRAGVLHAFAETLRTGVEPPFFPSGAANLGTLAMIEAALKSAANRGAPVRLEEVA